MDFSFGIITLGDNEDTLNRVIDSIEKQSIESYEILLMGLDV